MSLNISKNIQMINPEDTWLTADTDWWRQLVSDNFSTFIPALGILYLVGVFGGEILMKNREPFKLGRLLTVWNSFLALFSGLVVFNWIREGIQINSKYGAHSAFCHRVPHSPNISFWIIAFLLSKILELGDTAFLVLRKKPVIFLHWYHHFTILLSAFYLFPKFEQPFLVAGLVNAFVHTIMYTYYALMAAGWRLSKKVGIRVTSLQLLQFIIAFIGTIYSIYINHFTEGYCDFSIETIKYGMSQVLIYTILFVQIFRTNYKAIKMENSKEK